GPDHLLCPGLRLQNPGTGRSPSGNSPGTPGEKVLRFSLKIEFSFEFCKKPFRLVKHDEMSGIFCEIERVIRKVFILLQEILFCRLLSVRMSGPQNCNRNVDLCQ